MGDDDIRRCDKSVACHVLMRIHAGHCKERTGCMLPEASSPDALLRARNCIHCARLLESAARRRASWLVRPSGQFPYRDGGGCLASRQRHANRGGGSRGGGANWVSASCCLAASDRMMRCQVQGCKRTVPKPSPLNPHGGRRVQTPCPLNHTQGHAHLLQAHGAVAGHAAARGAPRYSLR